MSVVSLIYVCADTPVVPKLMSDLDVPMQISERNNHIHLTGDVRRNFRWHACRKNIKRADVTIVFAIRDKEIIAEIENYCRGTHVELDVNPKPCLIVSDLNLPEACAADIVDFIKLHRPASIYYNVLFSFEAYERIAAVLRVVTMLTSKHLF
jgi:hypothetical protein